MTTFLYFLAFYWVFAHFVVFAEFVYLTKFEIKYYTLPLYYILFLISGGILLPLLLGAYLGYLINKIDL